VFHALREGRIKLTDMVTISEHAWRQEGSRMFVEVGKQVTVEDLIQGMIVQSGNDATVALAEHVAGTEPTFVQMMNSYAKQLGMTGSHFTNAAGMPDPEHYMTARDAATPGAWFRNNVFAAAAGRLVLGHIGHPVRQREAERVDIRAFFRDVLGYAEIDLREQPGICELTGALVIDHARGLGFAGLTERCDEAGAAAMHAAFGLRATLLFELAPGEYHTNVVLSVLAGRAVVIAPSGIADPAVAAGIAALYAPAAIVLDADQKAAFTGNCIALSERDCWMSAAGAAALSPAQVAALSAAGFVLRTVELDEIEKAGGSLRCCVAEIF